MQPGSKYFAAGAVLATLGLLAVAHFDHEGRAWELQQRHLEVTARALGFAQLMEEVREDEAGEGLAQRFAEALPSSVRSVDEALIVKKARLLAHSDPERGGTRLSRDSVADKGLYDVGVALAGDVKKNVEERERSPELGAKNAFPEIEPKPAKQQLVAGKLVLAVPVKDGLRYRGAARVVGGKIEVRRIFPLRIALIGLACVVLFLLLGGRLKGTAQVLVGSVLMATMVLGQAFAYQDWSRSARRAHAESLAQTYGELSQAGLLHLAPNAEARAELVPQLLVRPTGIAAKDLVAIETASVAAQHEGATRIDAQAAAVFVPNSFLNASGGSKGLTLWAIAFAILGIAIFLLGAFGQLGRAGMSLWDHRSAYKYMSPALVGMLVLVFVPVLYGIALGFQKRAYNEYNFVGLDNFVKILSDTEFSDPQGFYFTLGVTLLWTVSNVVLHVSIGLFFALLLNDTLLKAKGIFRVLLIVPWAVPNYITALVWKGMFHKQFGAINLALQGLGFEPIAWFQSFWTSFFTNLATNTWLGFPFMMVVSLGALQSIPGDLYEAAIVDGATRWQRFKKITVPLLMPALVPAVMVGTVWTFNMFNIIYLVSGGAPDGATEILITDAFKWAFERDRYGYAAAYSTVIFVILILLTTLTNRITGATKGAFE